MKNKHAENISPSVQSIQIVSLESFENSHTPMHTPDFATYGRVWLTCVCFVYSVRCFSFVVLSILSVCRFVIAVSEIRICRTCLLILFLFVFARNYKNKNNNKMFAYCSSRNFTFKIAFWAIRAIRKTTAIVHTRKKRNNASDLVRTRTNSPISCKLNRFHFAEK